MPNGDEFWNNQEWFRYLANKQDEHFRHLLNQLVLKSDKADCRRDRQRINHLAVKVAGIAGVISLVIGLTGWLVGG
jgi:hypothetical protein